MPQYQKRPVVITAEQWLGWTADGLQEERLGLRPHPTSLILARIDTLESGESGYDVTPTDWIITGGAGEIYSCKDAIFRQSYVAVDAEGQTALDDTAPLLRSTP